MTCKKKNKAVIGFKMLTIIVITSSYFIFVYLFIYFYGGNYIYVSAYIYLWIIIEDDVILMFDVLLIYLQNKLGEFPQLWL